ncbi:hypothetical protein Sste5346_006363 [Sporothrix stenoceras]|uniref:T6SS Phospholipase effector Tle1-like catalytic domain-containing protein n=1 Tax=Sporothrix stenoceras TaxID=5173 RepID=A0ABR3YZZ2_9PEZI
MDAPSPFSGDISPALTITPAFSPLPKQSPFSPCATPDGASPDVPTSPTSAVTTRGPIGDPVKRLFVCCDGTWKNASGTQEPQTNVARLARATARMGRKSGDRPCIQIVYYAAGVGAAKTHHHLPSLLSGMSGKGIEADILDAYCFLSNNFTMAGGEKDDEIVLVGYSRGAFTVRCLASLINTIGLLRRRWLPLLPTLFDSWKMGGQEGAEGLEKITAKVRAAGTSSFIRIKILAEWEPVSATSVLNFVERDATVPQCVENAFVALARDERRFHFSPMVWRQWPGHDAGSGFRNLRQVVFRGGHGDIGGGNTDSGLATVPLLWMVAQIMSVSNAEFDNRVLFETILPMPASKAWLEWGGPGAKDEEAERIKGVARDPPPLHYVDVLRSRGDFVRSTLRRMWEFPSKLGIKTISGDRVFAFQKFVQTADDLVVPTLKTHFTVGLLLGNNRGKLWDTDPSAPDDPDDWAPIHSYEVLMWRRWRKHIQTQKPMPWDLTPGRPGQTRWERAANALNLVELPREAPVATAEQATMENYMTTDTLLGRLLLALNERYPIKGAKSPDEKIETKDENDRDNNRNEIDAVKATKIHELYLNVTYKKDKMLLK